MLSYVLRRLAWMVPTLIGVSLLTFALIHLAPGEPGAFLVGDSASGGAAVGDSGLAALERFRARHLLDQPLWRQYLHYVGPFDLGPDGHRWFGGSGERPWNGLLVGDLGDFFGRPEPVAPVLLERLRVTLPLAALAVLLSYLVAVPLGVLSAVRRGTAFDVTTTLVLFALYAVPTFWAGILLQLAFGDVGLGWLPVLGLHGRDAEQLGGAARLWDRARHLVLPVVCYAYASLAYLSRQTRVGVLDTIRQDYVRTARAKGLSERVVLWKHVLRNAVLPLLTLLASVLPALVGGSVLVEVVFDVPGMGRLAYEALTLREYDVVMATTLVSAAMTVAGILLADVAYALVDPRIRYR